MSLIVKMPSSSMWMVERWDPSQKGSVAQKASHDITVVWNEELLLNYNEALQDTPEDPWHSSDASHYHNGLTHKASGLRHDA
jgi:hypothetical protein